MTLNDLIQEVFKEQGYPPLDVYIDCCGDDTGSYVYTIDGNIRIIVDNAKSTFRLQGISVVRGYVDKTWNASDLNCIDELIQALRTYCPVFKWKAPSTWRPL